MKDNQMLCSTSTSLTTKLNLGVAKGERNKKKETSRFCHVDDKPCQDKFC